MNLQSCPLSRQGEAAATANTGMIQVMRALLAALALTSLATPAYADLALADSYVINAAAYNTSGAFATRGLNLLDEELNVKPKTWWWKELKEFQFDFVEPALQLKMSVDMKERHATFRLGDVKPGDLVGFRLSSDVDFRTGNPKVKAKLDLGFNGQRYQLELPEVTLVPRSYMGQRYIEYQLPLLQAKF